MSDTDTRRQHDRRIAPRGGRRESDRAWSTGRLARCIGMSGNFVLDEIKGGEITAARFGREYRIPVEEVRRYLTARGFPIPADLPS